MSRYQRVSNSEGEDHLGSNGQSAPAPPSEPLFLNRQPTASSQSETSTTFEEITEEEMDTHFLTQEEQEQTPLTTNTAAASITATTTTTTTTTSSSVTTAGPAPQRNARSSRPATLPVSNDGVFANLSAKPVADEFKDDEAPPTYEAAAQDAAPPYWQTTVIAPSVGGGDDQVMVEGLPVGNVFNFVWNMLISTSFQFIGFMLTYMLHTSHAAKNGSRAGLGITFIQYGFYLRNHDPTDDAYIYYEEDGSAVTTGSDQPVDPDHLQRNELIAYMLMVVGWFIVIRSVSDYVRAKRMEQIIQASPADATV